MRHSGNKFSDLRRKLLNLYIALEQVQYALSEGSVRQHDGGCVGRQAECGGALGVVEERLAAELGGEIRDRRVEALRVRLHAYGAAGAEYQHRRLLRRVGAALPLQNARALLQKAPRLAALPAGRRRRTRGRRWGRHGSRVRTRFAVHLTARHVVRPLGKYLI